MDKAPAYGAGDSGFESQYGLDSFSSGQLSFLVRTLGLSPVFLPVIELTEDQLNVRADVVGVDEKNSR